VRTGSKLAVTLFLAGVALAQTEPNAGTWKTWVIPSGPDFRAAQPPGPADAAAELQWLKDFVASSRDSNGLSQVRYWDAGSPGYRWMELALKQVQQHNIAAPLATRALALVAAAVYDATVAAWDSKYAYQVQRPSDVDSSITLLVDKPASPSYPSEHAAAAGAAAAVLDYLFPDNVQTFDSLADEAARSRLIAGVQFPSDTAAGMALGRSVGAAVISYARGDGSDAKFTGSFPPTPGVFSSANPTTPLAGSWKPWALSSGSQFRLDPPPPVGSDAAANELALVKNLARDNTTNHSAWFWQPSFFAPWLDTTNRLIFDYRLDTNPPRAALIYALATIAQHDATIACWDTKFTYLYPRPSMVDSAVVTVFSNPAHPSYPSGHACASGASAAALSALFPAEAGALQAQALDAGMSTFDAGIHYQNDVNKGLALGQNVGLQVVQTAALDKTQ
jgi:membrane-associated phospholipid phosphatase